MGVGVGGGWGWGLWFYIEATLHTNGLHNNSKSTGWIVFKFGTHSGSDSAPNLSTFHGYVSKVKVTSSQKLTLFLILKLLLLPHFVPKQVVRDVGIPSFTNTCFCPSVGSSHVQVLVHLQANPWWRHQMETFSALLAICAGNSPVNSRTKAIDAELWRFLRSAPE